MADNRMWCDDFDADLLKVVPGALEVLGRTADVSLSCYSSLTNGKINCPAAWNSHDGLRAMFWTTPEHHPDAYFYTTFPVAECTFAEAVRDEWVHGAVIVVNGDVIWRPRQSQMSKLMYDVRGWLALTDDKREQIQTDVMIQLAGASVRLGRMLGIPAGDDRETLLTEARELIGKAEAPVGEWSARAMTWLDKYDGLLPVDWTPSRG